MKNLPVDVSQGNVRVMSENHNAQQVPPGVVFLAFSGKKKTGKDTSMKIAKEMLESSGRTVQFAAFAEPLKDKICIDILGLDKALVYGSNEDKDKPTHILWDKLPEYIRKKYSKEVVTITSLYGPIQEAIPRSGQMSNREVMQIVGTDIFRKMLYDLVWADGPFRRKFDADVVILTDLRFPNEKHCTEEHGGVIIRLERETGLIDNHESETALDGYEFKYCYKNNGSLDDLTSYIRDVLANNKLL
jgi:hypothetical protein